MIDLELKELIEYAESKLKNDPRFSKDKEFKKKVLTIYSESKYNKKPIDLTNLINLNNTLDIGDLAIINHINNILINANEKLNQIIKN